jgi:hypothetical protein
MLRLTASYTGWLAAGLFAAVSVFGQGMHLLPGVGHPAQEGYALHAGCSCHGGHGGEAVESHEGDSCSDPDDCAICRWYSQAKVVTPPSAVERSPEVAAISPCHVPSFHCLEAPGPYEARAPPSA